MDFQGDMIQHVAQGEEYLSFLSHTAPPFSKLSWLGFPLPTCQANSLLPSLPPGKAHTPDSHPMPHFPSLLFSSSLRPGLGQDSREPGPSIA